MDLEEKGLPAEKEAEYVFGISGQSREHGTECKELFLSNRGHLFNSTKLDARF